MLLKTSSMAFTCGRVRLGIMVLKTPCGTNSRGLRPDHGEYRSLSVYLDVVQSIVCIAFASAGQLSLKSPHPNPLPKGEGIKSEADLHTFIILRLYNKSQMTMLLLPRMGEGGVRDKNG